MGPDERRSGHWLRRTPGQCDYDPAGCAVSGRVECFWRHQRDKPDGDRIDQASGGPGTSTSGHPIAKYEFYKYWWIGHLSIVLRVQSLGRRMSPFKESVARKSVTAVRKCPKGTNNSAVVEVFTQMSTVL